MKNYVIKFLKIITLFIIIELAIYFSFTTREFLLWCDEMGVQPFKTGIENINELDKDKINENGKAITQFADMIKEDVNNSYYKENTDMHSIGEVFDPVGYAVFSKLQVDMNKIVTKNIRISIFLSLAIVIDYIIFTNNKMSNMLKVIIGYISIIVIVPPIYMYSKTGRFWSLKEMYLSGTPKLFYILYTLLFIVMYIVNYKVKLTITKRLNKKIKD